MIDGVYFIYYSGILESDNTYGDVVIKTGSLLYYWNETVDQVFELEWNNCWLNIYSWNYLGVL
jgi:hypothetical protein